MNRITFAIAAVVMLSVGSEAAAREEGANCASAITLASNTIYTADTTSTTNWMTSFGPLISPSNDQLYTFFLSSQPYTTITPTVSNYTFAMYVIPSCADSGTEPPPIRATGTLGVGIDLSAGSPPLTDNTRYYLAVTGAASGGAGANGTVTFSTGFGVPVTLESFTVE